MMVFLRSWMMSIFALLLSHAIFVHSADEQIVLLDIGGAAGDKLGEGGAVFSSDGQYILACAEGFNTQQGKCIVFFETVLGDASWNSNQINLTDSSYVSGIDELGVSHGGAFSSDSTSIIACAGTFQNTRGKCLVFSESFPGARDWQDTQITLLDTTAADNTWNEFGLWGTRFSSTDEDILICSLGTSSRGKCMVFSETFHGDKDWHNNVLVLEDATAADSDRYTQYGGAEFSRDSRHILGCSAWVGKCIVFTKTGAGTKDWHMTQTILTDSNSAGVEYLGLQGASISDDNQHVVACAAEYGATQGKCVVWSASAINNTDWGNAETELIDDTSSSLDHLGYHNKAQFSPGTAEDIAVCAHYYQGGRGKCVVFSETTAGSRDWDTNQNLLIDPLGGSNDQLGYYGPVFSPSDNGIILACAWNGLGGRGKCVLFSETSPGTKDWGSNVAYVQDTTAVLYDFLSRGHPAVFSPDARQILACAAAADNDHGKCVLFKPDVLVNECDSSPCLSPAICQDAYLDFVCRCPSGFTGGDCLENIDDCASSPCSINAVCNDDALIPNSFNCSCLPGYSGVSCDVDVDDCIGNTACLNNGTCSDDGSEPNAFNCTCAVGYEGNFCTLDADDCVSSPCMNGSTCSDNGSAPNTFNCTCAAGFQGDICDTDVDDCLENPCNNNGTCFDSGAVPNTFHCNCTEGYAGDLCELDVDDCLINPCHNGSCSDDGSVPNSFNCTCDSGYTGDFCELEPPVPPVPSVPCNSSPCLFNGTCSNTNANTAFECECTTGRNGSICEGDVNDCVYAPCFPDGTSGCYDLGTDSYECKCNEGYTGIHCEVNEDSSIVLIFTLSNSTTAGIRIMLRNLEDDLEEEYPGLYVTAVLVETNHEESTATVSVTAWSEDMAVTVPSEEEVMQSARFKGYKVTVQADGDEDLNTSVTKNPFELYYIIGAIAIGLLVLALGIFLILRRKKTDKRLVQQDGFITPEEAALQEAQTQKDIEEGVKKAKKQRKKSKKKTYNMPE